MSIKRTFAILSLAMFATIACLFYYVNKTSLELERRLSDIREMDMVLMKITDFSVNLNSYKGFNRKRVFSRAEKIANDISTALAADFEETKGTAKDLAKIRNDYSELMELSSSIRLSCQSNGSPQLPELLHERFIYKNRELNESVNTYFFNLYESIGAEQHRLRALIYLVLALSLASVIMLYVYMNKRLLKGLDEIKEAARKFGQGQLDIRFDVARRDEIGALGRSFQQMVTDLQLVTASKESLDAEVQRRQESEARIEDERAFLDSVINALPGLFYTISPDGYFQRWNENFKEVSGYSNEELAAMSPVEMFAEDERELVRSTIQKVFERGRATVEAQLVTKTGECHPYYFTGVRAEVEEEQLLIGMGIDISDRKQIEEEMGNIFSMSMDMICIADLNTNTFTRVNPAFTKVLGYSEEELVGQSFLSFNHPDDVQPTIDIVSEQLKQGKAVMNFENRYRCKDGGYRWLSWVSYPDAEKGVTYAIARDVSDAREAADNLRRLSEELQRSNKELEQFAYVASHDLQEPLRMVASFTELVRERYDEKLDEKGRKYIAYAIDGAKRMQALVSDLLKLSRVGTRQASFEEVDCNELVTAVLEDLSKRVEETDANVSVGHLPPVVADASQLKLVFQNLVSNALKFCNADRPEVTIGSVERDELWEFSVADNGIGIDPQYHDRIFVIFQRLHQRGDYDGTGIGLSIVKKIVERHGGVITVESNQNEGATFKFTLPKR